MPEDLANPIPTAAETFLFVCLANAFRVVIHRIYRAPSVLIGMAMNLEFAMMIFATVVQTQLSPADELLSSVTDPKRAPVWVIGGERWASSRAPIVYLNYIYTSYNSFADL